MTTEQKHGKGVVHEDGGQCKELSARQAGMQLYLSKWPSLEEAWCERQSSQ